jgi:hypothetical protein
VCRVHFIKKAGHDRLCLFLFFKTPLTSIKAGKSKTFPPCSPQDIFHPGSLRPFR